MIVRKIKLHNYQIHSDLEVTLSALTFIKGKNGTGKTTLGLEAIMFGLWGYSSKNLTDIPSRDKSKSCFVELEIEHEGHVYIIKRSIPTQVTVKKDDVDEVFENSTEAQGYIKNLFGEPLTFKKFRMIDNEVGINFLDPKQATTLKKIIFSVSEQLFNEKKDDLQKMKQEREIWNKDNAVIYHHAPSQKRLDILIKGIKKTREHYDIIQGEAGKLQYEVNQCQGKISSSLSTTKYLQNDIEKAQKQIVSMASNQCYACGSSLDPKRNAKLIMDLQIGQKKWHQKITEQDLIVKDSKEETEEIQEMLDGKNNEIKEINTYEQSLNTLKMRLEARLKQKEYIYSTKDVEIVKRAIQELDNLSTRFLVNSVKSLEPIINEVLQKINYTLEFDINEKGKFDINLTDEEGILFKYKDLSTGQKLLLQIAFKLALLLERGEEGLMIADEGFGSLDTENLNHVLTIFGYYPFQLIFIVHHVEEVLPSVKVIDLNRSEDEKLSKNL